MKTDSDLSRNKTVKKKIAFSSAVSVTTLKWLTFISDIFVF